MNNLILTSCGIRNEDFKKRFYEIIPKSEIGSKKVLYITTAIDGEEDDDFSWVDEEYQTILDLGFAEENITEYKICETSPDIDAYDVIYMMGGNTIYLLDRVRKFNFGQFIRDFIDKGKVYIGSSAGSQIIGSTIELCSVYEDNNVGMTDFAALGLVDNEVVPHANKKEQLLSNLSEEERNKKILLYDDDGVII